jgi:transglutaminase-like putative cysteine protease
MRRLIRQGKRDPYIIETARSIVSTVPEKQFGKEIWAIWGFCRANVRYTGDIHDAEMIQPAQWVLKNGHGDCDDFTVLCCALLEAVGHPTRIVAVGRMPGIYSHVYLETKIHSSRGDHWLPVDCTMPHGPGWQPPGMLQRMEIFNGS